MFSGIKALLAVWLEDKSRPGLKVMKYLFFGGISFAVDMVVFYGLVWLVLPALRLDDPFSAWVVAWGGSIREVDENTLLRNYYVSKVLCFLASNTVAYVSNQLYVFKDGRHSRRREAGLFYLVGTLSFLFFTWFSGVLIGNLGWDVTYSNLLVFVLAMVANFTVRKRFVFRG